MKSNRPPVELAPVRFAKYQVVCTYICTYLHTYLLGTCVGRCLVLLQSARGASERINDNIRPTLTVESYGAD